jgi:mycothiol synthase
VEVWGRDRINDVMRVVGASMPGEGLTDDDVIGVLFDDTDPVHVIATDDGAGVAAAVVRTADGGAPLVHLQLLGVDPARQGSGLGHSLVAAIEDWAFTEVEAAAVVAGAGAPFYLFPGVDTHATAALCLFESRGFRSRGAEFNVSFPSSFRAPPPADVEIRRVLEESDAVRAVDFVARVWPSWVPEAERGIEHGACHVAIASDNAVLAFGCHSVNRLGWLGPMGTDPERRRGGVGTALLSVIAKDVMAAGFDRVEVSWIGPIGFYAKSAGASVSRVFRSLVLPRPQEGRRA